MTEKYITETVKAENTTLAQMVWALFRRQPVGYLESIFAANQDIAKLGYFIPVGTVIKFPINELPADTPVREVVRLWD